MGTGEFKAQAGVGAFLITHSMQNVQFLDLPLFVFLNVRMLSREVNDGPRYNSKCMGLVNQAKPGDVYYFEDVKARCPGDQAGRPINPLVFSIK